MIAKELRCYSARGFPQELLLRTHAAFIYCKIFSKDKGCVSLVANYVSKKDFNDGASSALSRYKVLVLATVMNTGSESTMTIKIQMLAVYNFASILSILNYNFMQMFLFTCLPILVFVSFFLSFFLSFLFCSIYSSLFDSHLLSGLLEKRTFGKV